MNETPPDAPTTEELAEAANVADAPLLPDRPGLYDLEFETKKGLCHVFLRFMIERQGGRLSKASASFQLAPGMSVPQVATAMRQAAEMMERRITADALDQHDALRKAEAASKVPS